MEKQRIILVAIIALAAFYHIAFNNGIEKTFFQTHVKHSEILRPICKGKYSGWNLGCIGMPSGHAEAATILSVLLMVNGFIAPWTALAIIVIVSAQRIVTHKHTLAQVMTGAALGGIYGAIYYKSLWFIVLIILIGMLLAYMSLRRIDELIGKGYPDWVDPVMVPAIKKKQNTPLIYKIIGILSNVICMDQTYMSWDELESYLDVLLERLKGSGTRWDAVVGIKTGGAIVSDYISKHLNIPNYKVKISKSKYNCDKKPSDLFADIKDVLSSNDVNDVEYKVCEPIEADLTGKNVILIDELVTTGRTMTRAYDYLLDTKKAAVVKPVCVTFLSRFYIGKLDIDYVAEANVGAWPWGYDN